jgi:glycosyltransferase involved in cell wall biosynthesis
MIRRASHRAGFRRPIFWIFQFNSAGVIRSLRPAFSVYECGEMWEAYETDPRNRRYIRAMDEALCRQADAVIVPSQRMLENKRSFNPHTYLIPWGADVAMYARARRCDTPLPADVARVRHPILGMFGMLDGRRLHLELLCHLATRHPDWQIVLVGRCMPNLNQAPLRALPNVQFLGMKRATELPAYCKAFDVCMIPYMVNEFTESIMPLKLAEYLATGKPIVTTALPATRGLEDVMCIADDIESFERGVCEALREEPHHAIKRVERAQAYDWEVVADRRMRIVSSLMRGETATCPQCEGQTAGAARGDLV